MLVICFVCSHDHAKTHSSNWTTYSFILELAIKYDISEVMLYQNLIGKNILLHITAHPSSKQRHM